MVDGLYDLLFLVGVGDLYFDGLVGYIRDFNNVVLVVSGLFVWFVIVIVNDVMLYDVVWVG